MTDRASVDEAGSAPHRADALDLLQRATAPIDSPQPLPRCLLLFAHPDDETLALGARLARFAHAASSLLVHVTDGAPRSGEDALSHGLSLEEYRSTRFDELTSALKHAGLSQLRRECLGIPDQESAHDLVGLTQRIAELLRDERPEVLFTHPYEGGHPDHDASAFAAHHAVHLLRREGEPVPVLIEPAFYHAGPEGIETGCFLSRDSDASSVSEIMYRLSPEEQRRKQALLHCFATQADTLQYFGLDHESFRLAPVYDFAQPPHDGPAFYDRFSWGITSTRFCELAALASETLRATSMLAEGVCR